jgi:5'-nucleotidase
MPLEVSVDELLYDKSVKSSGSHWRLEDGRTLHILHFNDVYNLDPSVTEEPIGGAARFATLMDYVQRDLLTTYGCHPLILFSGDFVGPSLMSISSKGAHIIEMLNLLGVHCATFGNHELDYGYDNLLDLLRGSNTHPASNVQWIATNMTDVKNKCQFGGAQKTLLFDWNGSGQGREKKSIRVGLLAVSEDWVSQRNTVRAGEIEYFDFIETAKVAAASLRSRGAEIVLALTHSRYKNDLELSKAVPDIDLILGGHDHFYKQDLDNRIVKSGEEWRWMSHVTVQTGERRSLTCKQYCTRGSIPPSPRVEVLCELYRFQCEERYKDVVFKLAVPMDPRVACVRFGESALANWICDACLWYLNEVCKMNVNVCVLPAFCFNGKKEFPAGDFTLGNLMTVFARGVVEMAIVCMGREELKKILNFGARPLPDEESCCLMHVSKGFGYNITGHGVEILSDVVESYIIAVPSTVLGIVDLSLDNVLKISGNEETKVLSEVMMQYCKANYSIYRGTAEFCDAMDPLVLEYVIAHLRSKLRNELCPANPEMGRITNFKQRICKQPSLNA